MQSAILIALIVNVLYLNDYQFVKSVDVPGDKYFSDPMGNVYVVKDNSLKKFTSVTSPENSRKETAQYTNTFLGNIHSIDISDPLRILLFYKDHNQIVWVDNFLSEILSPVSLDAIGVDQSELVCSSNQGGFWVFNGLNNQLQYYDVNLQLKMESPSLNILTRPESSPTFLLEKNRSLYLNMPGTGILVFDQFGNFSKTIPVETPSVFQVTDNRIYYMNENHLFSYHLRTAEILRLELPGEIKSEFLKAELQPGRLLVYDKKGYSVYRIDP